MVNTGRAWCVQTKCPPRLARDQDVRPHFTHSTIQRHADKDEDGYDQTGAQGVARGIAERSHFMPRQRSGMSCHARYLERLPAFQRTLPPQSCVPEHLRKKATRAHVICGSGFSTSCVARTFPPMVCSRNKFFFATLV